jgi:hypothetical protein
MKFQVTEISFDFIDDNFECPVEIQRSITKDCLGQIWDVNEEDDLVEEITSAYGWCVSSLDCKPLDIPSKLD